MIIELADTTSAGVAAHLVRVREEVVVQQESLPYYATYQYDDTVELDQRKEVTPGKYGLAVTRELIRYEDGVEVSRSTEATTTLVEPVDQVIAIGTKIKMSEKRCREIFDEVYQNCGDLLLNKVPMK